MKIIKLFCGLLSAALFTFFVVASVFFEDFYNINKFYISISGFLGSLFFLVFFILRGSKDKS
ncbi:MAG: hypothetical protein K6L73_13150 [Cellvibrionaceae bacterium]